MISVKDKIEKYYIRNKDLLPVVIEFKKTGIINEELGLMVQQIAINYSNRGNFASYTWKEDMVSDAVLVCFKYMHNFDPDKQKKPNPFSYFTTIIHNAFINYIRKQKKHSDIKDFCYKNYNLIEEENKFYHYAIRGIDYQIMRKNGVVNKNDSNKAKKAKS